MKTPLRLLVLALLALTGLVVSFVQTQHFHEVRSGTGAFRSFCTFGSSFNCEVIDASPWAELVLGLPLSSFAAGWFLALLVVAFLARRPTWRREGVRTLQGMAGVGVAFSLVYLAIMVFAIKVYCLLCLVIDGVNVAALAIALGLTTEVEAAAPTPKKKDKAEKQAGPPRAKWAPLGAIVLACLLVTVGGLRAALDAVTLSSARLDEIVKQVLETPPVNVRSGPEFPSIGSEKAAITLVVFSDFQCSHCRMGALVLHPLLKKYEGKLRVVFRNFPMDSACNKLAPSANHPAACEAALAAVCAQQQGKFEAVYESFFENQTSLKPGRPTELALAVPGMNAAAFQQCMAAPATAQAVSQDILEGFQLQVQTTPTFFVNGHRVDGAVALPVWVRILDRMLQQP